MVLEKGDRATIRATAFDVKGAPRWSTDHFPTLWKVAIITGSVLRPAQGRNNFMVKWDIDRRESVHSRGQLTLLTATTGADADDGPT